MILETSFSSRKKRTWAYLLLSVSNIPFVLKWKSISHFNIELIKK